MIPRGARNLLVAGLGYGLVLEAMLVTAIEFWPDFEANIGVVRLLTKIPAVRGLLGVLQQGELPGYVTFQHFFKDCNLIGTAAAILLAVNAVAGEAHRGTLELWLARPRSRLRSLLERFTGGALVLLVPVFLTTWSIPALLERQEETIELEPLMLGAVHQSCMLLALYAATFFLSSVGRNPVRIAIGMFLFGASQLTAYFVMEATSWSLVRLVDPRLFVDLFATRALDWEICGSLLGFSALALAASAVAVRRRIP